MWFSVRGARNLLTSVSTRNARDGFYFKSSVSLLLLCGASQIVHAEGRTDSLSTKEEKLSQTKFPTIVEGYTHDKSVHWLLGVSIRCMMGFCSLPYARAYSYGIYASQECLDTLQEEHALGMPIEAETIHKTMLPSEHIFKNEVEVKDSIPAETYEGRKPGYVYSKGKGYELRNHEAALSVKNSGSYDSCMIRLIMLRDVKCSHVARGFDTTFQRRLKTVHKDNKEACQAFLSVINADTEWKKGTVLDLLRLPEGRLEIIINGEVRQVIESEAVSFAVFDVYLGHGGHLSKKVKNAIGERCSELIRSF